MICISRTFYLDAIFFQRNEIVVLYKPFGNECSKLQLFLEIALIEVEDVLDSTIPSFEMDCDISERELISIIKQIENTDVILVEERYESYNFS